MSRNSTICLISHIELKVGCYLCSCWEVNEPRRSHTPVSFARVRNTSQKKTKFSVLTLIYSNLEVVYFLEDYAFTKIENKFKTSLHHYNFGVRMN